MKIMIDIDATEAAQWDAIPEESTSLQKVQTTLWLPFARIMKGLIND